MSKKKVTKKTIGKKVKRPAKKAIKKKIAKKATGKKVKKKIAKKAMAKKTKKKVTSKQKAKKKATKKVIAKKVAKKATKKAIAKKATKKVAKKAIAKKVAKKVTKKLTAKKSTKKTQVDVEFLIQKEPAAAEVVITDAQGRRYCQIPECDQFDTVEGYCRYHYLLHWKKIQLRRKILSEGKLDKYISNLTDRYPDRFLEILKNDLKSQANLELVLHDMGELGTEEETKPSTDDDDL